VEKIFTYQKTRFVNVRKKFFLYTFENFFKLQQIKARQSPLSLRWCVNIVQLMWRRIPFVYRPNHHRPGADIWPFPSDIQFSLFLIENRNREHTKVGGNEIKYREILRKEVFELLPRQISHLESKVVNFALLNIAHRLEPEIWAHPKKNTQEILFQEFQHAIFHWD
jgi:hypothetical protein